ncbi:MAG: type II CAAX endopeptidase family protein [Tissierellia bacterium]|nr:type II CAAX endopeptidase family protein [Tissierellia bacterium]
MEKRSKEKIRNIAIVYILSLFLVPKFVLSQLINLIKADAQTVGISYVVIISIAISIWAIIYYKEELLGYWNELKGRRLNLFLTAIAGFVILLLLQSVFFMIFGDSIGETQNQKTIESLNIPIITTIFPILSILLGPILEELVFREYIVGRFKGKLPGVILVLISAALFAIVHMTSLSELKAATPYFLHGIIGSVIYIKSGYNICYPILMHMVNNIIAQLLIYLK